MFWPISQSREWVIGLRTNLGFGIGYGDSEELPFFNNFFAGGLIRGGGQLRGYEENSLGPRSTPGARYLTDYGISLARDEEGNILRNIDGTAQIDNSVGYRTEALIDQFGNIVLDANGNPQVRLAVQDFYLDDDYDSFGGNILTTATLELLFPLPFVPNRTSAVIYNFFSQNYSIRKNLLLRLSLILKGEIVHQRLIWIKPNLILEIDNELIDYNDDAETLILELFNPRLPRNHGGQDGHFRFWGKYYDNKKNYLSTSHSMPLNFNLTFKLELNL